MPKRIIVLSDGTGNSAAKAEKTNVWRTFQAIDQSLGEQLAMYDDGVGTSSNKYLAALGGAIGYGLQRNVLELYQFVCRTYQPGDDLFGFGFSRGAYTIRTLVDFMLQEGLVDYRSEVELERNSRRAYARYRASCFKPTWPAISPVYYLRVARKGGSALLDRVLKREPLPKRVPAEKMAVRFLGLWDTVGAYGMPVEELRPVINCLIWPMFWNNLELSPKVARACHALALDDERSTFHPIIWDEAYEAKLIKQDPTFAGRLSQVWFAGVHSNVGGGYPEDQLSLVSLDWMLSQAADAGLNLLPAHLEQISRDKSSYARRYDSRHGLGVFYRYSPRVIKTYAFNSPIWPVIHHSVLMRMAYGTDRYAPLPLTEKFHVLTPEGNLIDFPPGAGLTTGRTGSGKRQILRNEGVEVRQERLLSAVASIGAPDGDALELRLDTVWWRRVAYFVTLFSLLALLSLPFTGPLFEALHDTHVSEPAQDVSSSLVGRIVDLLQPVIPEALSPLMAALKAFPFAALLLIAGIFSGLTMSAQLNACITDLGQRAWHFGAGHRYREWLLLQSTSKLRRGIAALALLLVTATWAFSGGPSDVSRGGVQVGILALLASLASTYSLYSWKCIRSWSAALAGGGASKPLSPAEPALPLPLTPALRCARYLRKQPVLGAAYQKLANGGIPIALGLVLAGVMCVVANKLLIEWYAWTGDGCEAQLSKAIENPRPVQTGAFQAKAFCAGTGIQLKAGRSYRITLDDTGGRLFDHTVHADLGGFSGADPVHKLAKPLRRWWAENWFTPIARVGEKGGEEYALHPLAGYHARNSSPRPDASSKEDKCWKVAQPPCGLFDQPGEDDVNRWSKINPTPQERLTLVTEITPKRNGELFMYVNDASMPLYPQGQRRYYKNNYGSVKVKVEEMGL